MYVNIYACFARRKTDPICVKQNLDENISMFKTAPGAVLALTKCGSHCPFYDYRMNCWAEKVILEIDTLC